MWWIFLFFPDYETLSTRNCLYPPFVSLTNNKSARALKCISHLDMDGWLSLNFIVSYVIGENGMVRNKVYEIGHFGDHFANLLWILAVQHCPSENVVMIEIGNKIFETMHVCCQVGNIQISAGKVLRWMKIPKFVCFLLRKIKSKLKFILNELICWWNIFRDVGWKEFKLIFESLKFKMSWMWCTR